MSKPIVVCAACRRRLLWTVSEFVTCPAGHTALFQPMRADIVRPMNTPFDGWLHDLRGGETSDKLIEVRRGEEAEPLRPYWTPRKGG